MDSEPVRLWREKFKLNLSASWKHDVEVTVTDIDLWKSILASWGYWKDGKWHRKAPGIKGLLDEYERRQFDEIAKNRRTVGADGSRESVGSERIHWEMPPLLD